MVDIQCLNVIPLPLSSACLAAASSPAPVNVILQFTCMYASSQCTFKSNIITSIYSS